MGFRGKLVRFFTSKFCYGAYSKIFGHTAVSPFYSFRVPGERETDFTALIFNDIHQEKYFLNSSKSFTLHEYFFEYNIPIVDDANSNSKILVYFIKIIKCSFIDKFKKIFKFFFSFFYHCQ